MVVTKRTQKVLVLISYPLLPLFLNKHMTNGKLH